MKKSILIVEDDLPTIDIYETVFNKEGFEVFVAPSGAKAFERLEEIESGKTGMPDLVLLDIILPDINGIEILAKIRKSGKTKNLPVFILTNYTDKELEKMGYKLKTEQYILKADCTPSKLVPLVRKRLGLE